MNPQTAQKHREAKLFLDSLGVTPALSLLLRVMSWFESRYGTGWKVPSHNWGAIVATPEWTGKTFRNADPKYGESVNDPKAQQSFRYYPNDQAGVEDMIGVLRRKHPDSIRLAELGRWEEISESLFKSGYYTGRLRTPEENIAAHATNFLTLLNNIVEATKEKSYLPGGRSASSGSGSSAGKLLVLSLILTATGYIFYSTVKGKWRLHA